MIAVRHAAVRSQGLCYGRSDVVTEPVASHLAQLAAELGQQLGDSLPVVIWSSPSRRCLEVALPLGAGWPAPVLCDDRLLELSFGSWEGRAWSDLEQEEPDALARWMQNYQQLAPPGGETVSALEARVASFLSDPGENASSIVVTHAGVIRAMQVLLHGWTWERALAWPVPFLTCIAL